MELCLSSGTVVHFPDWMQQIMAAFHSERNENLLSCIFMVRDCEYKRGHCRNHQLWMSRPVLKSRWTTFIAAVAMSVWCRRVLQIELASHQGKFRKTHHQAKKLYKDSCCCSGWVLKLSADVCAIFVSSKDKIVPQFHPRFPLSGKLLYECFLSCSTALELS